jgi:hypothetical protein
VGGGAAAARLAPLSLSLGGRRFGDRSPDGARRRRAARRRVETRAPPHGGVRSARPVIDGARGARYRFPAGREQP